MANPQLFEGTRSSNGGRSLHPTETRMFSDRLMALFHSRSHEGSLESATHEGVAGTPGQGPYLQMRLRVVDGVVEAARFETYGCPSVIASGEAVCQLAEGRPVDALPLITPTVVTKL